MTGATGEPGPGLETDAGDAAAGDVADPGWSVSGPVDAPAILFIHGTRLSRSSWQAQVSRLDPAFRIVALDLPGHGTRAAEPFHLASAAETAASVIDAAAGGRAIVVGLSLGGYVAMELAARRPDRVAGLVLVGASGEPRGALGASLRALATVMRRVDADRLATLNRRYFRLRYPPAIAEPVISGGFWFRGGSEALMTLVGEEFRPRLAAYPGESLILNGALDVAFRPGGRAFHAAARHGSLAVVPGATHLANLDRPKAFSAIVDRFARRVSSGS